MPHRPLYIVSLQLTSFINSGSTGLSVPMQHGRRNSRLRTHRGGPTGNHIRPGTVCLSAVVDRRGF